MRIRSNNYEKVCHQIAVDISNKVKNGNHLVLGLATGSTPIGIYKELVKMKPDFSKTTTFNLDEYVELEETHDQSYRYFMNEHLFQYFDFEQSYFPNEQNHHEYDIMISNYGGIDVQILGIGTNGHIAFNEPNSDRYSSTRVVDLTQNTIEDNSRFFENIKDVPTQAYTMGLSSIMEAEEIHLVAVGKHKKDILERSMNGEITPEIPASYLQQHKKLKVYYSDR